MGVRRCCCNCVLWSDGFDRDPGDTAPDGINYLGSAIYSGELADWSLVSGKLVAGVADSQINFHDGAAKLYHVFAFVSLPNVGDYVRVHYGADYAMVERLASSMRYTIDGHNYETGSSSATAYLTALFFPRAKHAYYYDAFPDTVDADIISVQPFASSALGTPPTFTPCLVSTGLDDNQSAYKADLGSGFATWGFTASVGAGVESFAVWSPRKKCLQLVHSCCTPCWAGTSDTTSLTVAGLVNRSGDCPLEYFNQTFVLDREGATFAPCGWDKWTEPPSPQDPMTAARQIISSLTQPDPDVDEWYIEVDMPWIAIGAGGIAGRDPRFWTSAVLTREQVCTGGTIPLVPGSAGVAAGYDIYADELRPDGWVDCGPADGTPPPHTAISLSFQL